MLPFDGSAPFVIDLASCHVCSIGCGHLQTSQTAVDILSGALFHKNNEDPIRAFVGDFINEFPVEYRRKVICRVSEAAKFLRLQMLLHLAINKKYNHTISDTHALRLNATLNFYEAVATTNSLSVRISYPSMPRWHDVSPSSRFLREIMASGFPHSSRQLIEGLDSTTDADLLEYSKDENWQPQCDPQPTREYC